MNALTTEPNRMIRRLVDALESSDSKSKIWKSSFVAAKLAYEEGSFKEAYHQLLKTLKRAEGVENRTFAEGCTKMGLGAVLTKLNKFDEASKYFNQAESVSSQDHGNTAMAVLYAVTLMFHADLLMEKGNLDIAEQKLLKSVEILEKLGSQYVLFLSNSLCDLSGLYLQLERYDLAEDYIKAAVTILATVNGRTDATFLRADLIQQICTHKNDEEYIFDLVKQDTTKMLYQVGTKHPNLTRALRRYAQHLHDKGQEDKLEELHDQFESVFK